MIFKEGSFGANQKNKDCSENSLDDDNEWERALQKILDLKTKSKIKENEMLLKIEELEDCNLLLENSLKRAEKENKLLKQRNSFLENLIKENNIIIKEDEFQPIKESENKENSKNGVKLEEDKQKIKHLLEDFKITDLLIELDKKKFDFYSSCSSLDITEKEKKQNVVFSNLDAVRDFRLVHYENSNYIVSAGEDCLVNIFDIKKEKKETLRGHLGPIFKMTHSITHDFIVTGGCEGNIQKWNLKDIFSKNAFYSSENINYFGDCITSLDINPFSGEFLLANSADMSTKVINTLNQEIVFDLSYNFYQSYFNKFHLNRVLLLQDNETVYCEIDLNKHQKQFFDLETSVEDTLFTSIDFNIPKNFIIFASDEGLVFFIDDRERNSVLQKNFDSILSSVKSIDNLIFLAGSSGLQIYDIRKDQILHHFDIGNRKYDENLTHIEIDIFNDILYVSSVDGNIYFIDNYI